LTWVDVDSEGKR